MAESNLKTHSTRFRALTAAAIIAGILLIDQLIKIWVKTSFFLGEDYEIASWFHLRFIENNGMAFGMELGSKLLLTMFRLVATALGIWYLCRLAKDRRMSLGYVAVVAMIVAGALGNIIDCVFYGEIFNNPYPPQVATFVPWGEGYGTLFHGLVVDMFYFPLFSFTWPDWLPWVGGSEFSFFDPVFNFADAAISVGMFLLIICYSSVLAGDDKTKEKQQNVK